MISWHNGKFVKNPIMINSNNYSLHYGPCVWEGIRAYECTDRITRAFKADFHIKRLFDSLKMLNIKVDFTQAQVVSAIDELIKRNNMKDCYIRPAVYSAGSYADLQEDAGKYNFDIHITQMGKNKNTGIDVITSSYQRSYPNVNMQCKVSANYLTGQLAELEAKAAGADDALLTDKDGYYTESSVGNLFIIKDGVFATPPNEGSILNGIPLKGTRQV